MIKKVFIVLFIICVTLCSCDSEIKSVNELPITDFIEETMNDITFVEKKYIGHFYKINAYVNVIKDDYVVLLVPRTDMKLRDFYVHAYFPKDEIEMLTAGERINLIGRITAIDYEDSFSFGAVVVKLEKAQYIDNITIVENIGIISTIADECFILEDDNGNTIDALDYDCFSDDFRVYKFPNKNMFFVNDIKFQEGDIVHIVTCIEGKKTKIQNIDKK